MTKLKQTKLTDLERYWFIRITLDDINLELIYNMVKDRTKFVISEEGDGINVNVHYHIVLLALPNETNDMIKKMIKQTFPSVKGNKHLFSKLVTQLKQAIKYTLKEGNYKYKGFTEENIKELFKCSAPKTNLRKDVSDLQDDYMMKRISKEMFLEKYIELKAKHDQPIYPAHIKAYMIKMMIKTGDLKAGSISDTILGDINMSFGL